MRSVKRQDPQRHQVERRRLATPRSDLSIRSREGWATSRLWPFANAMLCARAQPRDRSLPCRAPASPRREPGLRVRPVMATRAGCATAFMGRSCASIHAFTVRFQRFCGGKARPLSTTSARASKVVGIVGNQELPFSLLFELDVAKEVDHGVRDLDEASTRGVSNVGDCREQAASDRSGVDGDAELSARNGATVPLARSSSDSMPEVLRLHVEKLLRVVAARGGPDAVPAENFSMSSWPA